MGRLRRSGALAADAARLPGNQRRPARRARDPGSPRGKPLGNGWPLTARVDYTAYTGRKALARQPFDDGVWLGDVDALEQLPEGVSAVISLCLLGRQQVPPGVEHIAFRLIDRAETRRTPTSSSSWATPPRPSGPCVPRGTRFLSAALRPRAGPPPWGSPTRLPSGSPSRLPATPYVLRSRRLPRTPPSCAPWPDPGSKVTSQSRSTSATDPHQVAGDGDLRSTSWGHRLHIEPDDAIVLEADRLARAQRGRASPQGPLHTSDHRGGGPATGVGHMPRAESHSSRRTASSQRPRLRTGPCWPRPTRRTSPTGTPWVACLWQGGSRVLFFPFP